MAQTRIVIPRSIQIEVLFRNEHTCCICRNRHKDVQLHHIDGNPGNNDIENLAVICLDCHSKVSGPGGLGKSYSTEEVMRYKQSWENAILASRIPQPQSLSHEEELLSQIDLVVCEVLSLKESDPRVSTLLGILYELNLLRGVIAGNEKIRRQIVEGFDHLAFMGGMTSPKLAVQVTKKLWELCWEYVGPEDVKMDSDDREHVIECIEAICRLSVMNASLEHSRKVLDSVAEYLEYFYGIAMNYLKPSIANAVIKVHSDTIDACYWNEELQWPYGHSTMRRSIRNLLSLMDDESLDWHKQREELQSLLDN